MTEAMTSEVASPWMSYNEVCAHYDDASRSWVYSAVASGDLPAPVSIGGKRLFSRSAIFARDAERVAEAERETQARRAAHAA